MRIVGLDLSLTATGIAVLDDRDGIRVSAVGSKGAKDATIAQRVARLDDLERAIINRLGNDVDLVVIEAPSFGQMRQSGEHLRAGLWWRLVSLIENTIAPVAEVPPATLKKYATGKGNATKDAVLLATARRFPTVDVTTNDEADALWLCAAGAQVFNQPIVDVPLVHLEALDKVVWPHLEGLEAA